MQVEQYSFGTDGLGDDLKPENVGTKASEEWNFLMVTTIFYSPPQGTY